MLEKLIDNVYRICIPFEDIYTTSFVVLSSKGCIVYDSGCNKEDAQGYVIPALEKLGVIPDFILCSHSHGDHCGGLSALSEVYPDAVVGSFSAENRYRVNNPRKFADGEIILDKCTVLNLKGHSADGLALLDTETKMLISGDCIQAGKVGRYGIGVSDCGGYLATLKKLKNMKLNYIFTSHNYLPLGFSAMGEIAVIKYLTECQKQFELKLKHLKEKQ